MQILFDRANITSTARVSSVFLSSYESMVLKQSARVFALGYFLIGFNWKASSHVLFLLNVVNRLEQHTWMCQEWLECTVHN